MDTKTDFNLNNIIATLSLISISSVKNSPANVLTRTQNWSQLRSMNAKAGKYRRSELRGLDVTIAVRYHWSVARQLIPFPLRHQNLSNLTLQQECYLTNTWAFSAYALLYIAAASPASHLRSAGSLAIKSMIKLIFNWFLIWMIIATFFNLLFFWAGQLINPLQVKQNLFIWANWFTYVWYDEHWPSISCMTQCKENVITVSLVTCLFAVTNNF